MKKGNWIGIVLSFVLTIAGLEAIDRTQTERATGRDVVQTVVDIIGQKCIFPNDRLFVRRMAYVETKDGTASSTFRPGFYGGIWQITRTNYEATKLKCKGALQKFCTEIKKEFKIDWQKTSWKDLLKPFYSGLAAYLSLAAQNNVIPADPVEQGKIWKSVFHTKAFKHSRNFSKVSSALSSTTDCNGRTDLVFLMDESGSVGSDNFDKMKEFLEKTVGHLTIGPKNIRVSLVKFGTSSTIVNYLNQHQTYEEIVKSINGLTYNAESTATDEGINTVTNEVFSIQNGAIEAKDAPRVLVLLTDGQSNNRQETIKAAENAKSNKIEIFSVGIGSGIDYDELRQVAYKCNAVFTLNTFDDFDYFINQLTKKTCEANAHVTLPESNANGTVDKDPTINVPVDDKGIDTRITVDPPNNITNNNSTEGGQTIVVETTCVIVKVYGSYDNENPSESMFEITGTASDGRPVVLFVKADNQGRPLFLRFKATKVNSTEKVCLNSGFAVKINRGKPKVGNVICEENGFLRNCTTVDLIDSKWKDKICSRDSDISTIGGNPCTPENLRAKKLVFPYPNDNTKFIKCDMKGRVYAITCPEGLFYKPGRESCGADTNLPMTKEHLTGTNPCTHENLINHHMYFPYPPNHNKFIQCDEWGVAWVVACPGKMVWDQKITQCVPENAEMNSPCTEEARRNGNFYFPYPSDKHQYIHCTNNGDSFIIQSCGNMVYDDNIHNCMPG